MPLVVKDNGGKDFKKVPQGTHVAVCNLVADCGVQPGGRYKPQHKVYVRWEVPGERVEYEKDGQTIEGPLSIGKFYTASLSEKATLRKELENWRGRSFTPQELAGFDVFNILGAPCQIVVTHTKGADGKDYANVTSVIGLPKGMPKPSAENKLIKFSPDEPAQFNDLPKWLQEKCQGSVGAEVAGQPQHSDEPEFDDDIPF